MTSGCPRLLIVDDNMVDRMNVMRLLSNDFTYIEATTAEEGLELAAEQELDCVLLDYLLPDCRGVEIIHEFVNRNIPVIMLTGEGAEEIAVQAIKGGASDYLIKGKLSREALERAIRFALREQALRTERDTLASTERELLTLVENTTDLVCTMTPDGTLRYLNQPGLQLIGGTDLAEKHISSLLSDEEYLRFQTTIMPIVCTHGTWAGELVLRTTTDEEVPSDAVVVGTKDEDGKLLFAAAIVRDMRGRLALESQLQHAVKMEAVGRLAGGIAHDFNNVLTAILCFSMYALEDLNEADPVRGDIYEIQEAAKRAEALTGQLLSFSRKRTIQPRIFDPNEELATLRRMLERLIGEDVELEVYTGSTGSVRADPSALEQVMVNLTVNARDAMPLGGRLTVETYDAEVSAEYAASKGVKVPPGSYIVISIGDTGMGMDKATQERIFEPFFSTKGPGNGTGLGLATVYGIVKQAGGFIWVYSELGVGTEFKVYLPRLSTSPTAAKADKVAPVPTGTEKILLIDDDAQMRRLAARALRQLGYDVVVAETSSEALLLIEQNKVTPDLLLTDVVMPQIGGKQLAIRLASHCPKMKVLFMSGYSASSVMRHGIVEKGVALLQKPFAPKDLATHVRQVLDKDAYYAAQLASRKLTLLIVGEEDDSGSVLKSALEDEFHVVLAVSGQAALEIIKSDPPDIVLSNGVMSAMGGIELFEFVAAMNLHLASQFVFMTEANGAEHDDLLLTTRRPILRKPVILQELKNALGKD